MATSTTRYTNVVKIAEFPEMASALKDASNSNSDNRFAIVELIHKQTEAKQAKFWKYFDSQVICCEECATLFWADSKVTVGSKEGAFCSRECAYKAMGVKEGN